MNTRKHGRASNASSRRLAYARGLFTGQSAYQAALAAGYAESVAKARTKALSAHPEVAAEVARLRSEVDTAAIASRTEVMEVLSGVVRREIPAEEVETTAEGPQGSTTTRKVSKSPVQAARLLSDLEGWTQPPGAGQEVQIQIVLGPPPPMAAGAGGWIYFGDGSARHTGTGEVRHGVPVGSLEDVPSRAALPATAGAGAERAPPEGQS